MSEDFEDISVVDTTAEEVPSAEPIIVAEAPVAEMPVEVMPAEIAATQLNLDPADDALKQNAQQAYAEQYMPERSGGVAPITEAGRQAKESTKEEKQSELIEHLQQADARQKEWMEREHEFGGMKMSGHDLAKLIDFISNPQMQDKLRERLGKSGVPKEKIDKGMKELNEFIDLKKKEQEGVKLTEDQQRRLKELEKSEEFKAVAAAAAQQARDDGVKFDSENLKTVKTANTTNIHNVASSVRNEIKATRNNLDTEKSNGLSFENEALSKPTLYSRSAPPTDFDVVSPAIVVAHDNQTSSKSIAYAHFTSAPDLGEEFTSKVSQTKPALAANDFKSDFGTLGETIAVTQVQNKPRAIDISFG